MDVHTFQEFVQFCLKTEAWCTLCSASFIQHPMPLLDLQRLCEEAMGHLHRGANGLSQGFNLFHSTDCSSHAQCLLRAKSDTMEQEVALLSR